jgi:ribosomal protein L19
LNHILYKTDTTIELRSEGRTILLQKYIDQTTGEKMMWVRYPNGEEVHISLETDSVRQNYVYFFRVQLVSYLKMVTPGFIYNPITNFTVNYTIPITKDFIETVSIVKEHPIIVMLLCVPAAGCWYLYKWYYIVPTYEIFDYDFWYEQILKLTFSYFYDVSKVMGTSIFSGLSSIFGW